MLAQAEAASTDTKVRMLHPDWDGEQEGAEVDRIHAETGGTVPTDLLQAVSLPAA